MQSYGSAPPRIGKVAPGAMSATKPSGLIGSRVPDVPTPKLKPNQIQVRGHIRTKPSRGK